MNNPIEGWYPDPDGTPRLRWWNGSDWTESYIVDERASNGPVTGSVPPPTTGPIDPITGTIAHATTGHIDPFTGSIARPVAGTTAQPFTAAQSITGTVDPVTGRIVRPGEEPDGLHPAPDVPTHPAVAPVQPPRYSDGPTIQIPKNQIITAIITTLLVIGFSAGLALTGRMYMSATSEYEQAQQSFHNANSDLEKAKEAAK